MQSLVTWFVTHLGSTAGKKLTIFIISMIPILELRGGLLAASPALLDVPILQAIPVCIIGNLIPVPFILKFITPVFDRLKRTKRIAPLVEKLEKKALDKSDRVSRYEFWGLVLFVGIPLPGTGAWTGTLGASLIDMKFKDTTLAVMCGVLIAGVIMMLASIGVFDGLSALFAK